MIQEKNISAKSNIYLPKTRNVSFGAKVSSAPVQNPFALKNDTFEYSDKNSKNAISNDLKTQLSQIKSKQGFIGKLWDGFKNLTHIGASSNKVEDKIKAFEKGEITYDEAMEAIEKYKAGQNMVVDVIGDMASGIVAVGAFALAVPTGGTSLAIGLALATATGAGVKIGVKAGDAITGKREYTSKDLLYDTVTGSINGLLAPVTNGIGASVTKTIGTKMGLTVVKEGTEEVIEAAAKQGIKSIITQQGVDVVGGTFLKRATATAAGMAVDGALGGASDNMVRAALNGEDVVQAGVQGAVGGLIMAPVIGGGFKAMSKAGKALNNKIVTKNVLPDGMNTVFKQGDIGDCALLSTIDGMMNNESTQKLIKNSITKSIGGDYQVNIGGKLVTVAKSSLTDEMLADTTGIKIFEQAYKQLSGGNLDGGFADVVARQYGLSPIHIAQDGLTDEILDKLAKEQGIVLSLGAKIDVDGNIAADGISNHYFTVKKIDSTGKKLTLSNPLDTSKTFDISYEQAKKLGISLDGGSIKPADLPNAARSADELAFFGKNAPKTRGIIDQQYIEQQIMQGKFKEGISTLPDGTIVVNSKQARSGDSYYAIFKPDLEKGGGYWFDSRYATEGYGYMPKNTPVKDLYFSQLDINANGKALVDSMKKNGFKGEALHAVRITVDGKEYLFCYDNRRLSAAIQAKMKDLPVVVHDATDIFCSGDPLCHATWGDKIIERLKNFGKGTTINKTGSCKNPTYTSTGLPLETFYSLPKYRNVKAKAQPKSRSLLTKGYLK